MFKLVKLSVLLIIVSSCAFCSKLEVIKHVQSEPGSLQKDLSEFLNIIPVDDIRNLTEYFYENDEKMRKSYDYLRTDGYKLVVESVFKLTLVKKFTTFLNDTGVNFAELGKRIEKIVLTDEEAKSIVGNCSSLIASVAAAKVPIYFSSSFSQLVSESFDDLGGFNAFFNEALLLIPQDEVLALFFSKMEESNAFSSFLEKLNASDYENLTENLKVRRTWKKKSYMCRKKLQISVFFSLQKSQGIQSIYFEFLSYDIDIMEMAKVMRKFVGYWEKIFCRNGVDLQVML